MLSTMVFFTFLLLFLRVPDQRAAGVRAGGWSGWGINQQNPCILSNQPRKMVSIVLIVACSAATPTCCFSAFRKEAIITLQYFILNYFNIELLGPAFP